MQSTSAFSSFYTSCCHYYRRKVAIREGQPCVGAFSPEVQHRAMKILQVMKFYIMLIMLYNLLFYNGFAIYS